MEKEFVPYELAVKIKALGFDEPCFDASDYLEYNQKDIAIPTFSQAFRWFRENYSWTIENKQVTKSNWSYTLNNFPKERTYYGKLYETYEEAELACLDKLIEIVESKSE